MRRGGGGVGGGRHRHRRDQHADAPPAGDRGVGEHDARAHRGRFALGIGRGIAPLLGIMGIPPITMAQMEDAVGIYRRLWKGEAVFGHDGPAGTYPLLTLGSGFDADIPVMAACLGFKTMRWAGRVLDGVILHTFVTDEALARCVAEVRAGAEEAGRDPASVKVWAVLATLHEPDHERLLRGVTGRMATYFQAYGDALVAMNGWDPAPLERVPRRRGRAVGAGRHRRRRHHRAARAHPDPHPRGVAPRRRRLGRRTAPHRVLDQLAAGADGVILHGSSPAELEPVVQAYAQVRPEGALRGPGGQPRPVTSQRLCERINVAHRDDISSTDVGGSRGARSTTMISARERSRERVRPGAGPARAVRLGAARGVRLPGAAVRRRRPWPRTSPPRRSSPRWPPCRRGPCRS